MKEIKYELYIGENSINNLLDDTSIVIILILPTFNIFGFKNYIPYYTPSIQYDKFYLFLYRIFLKF